MIDFPTSSFIPRGQGFLFAFEGPDGSGKSTQLKLLKEWLVAQGHDVVTTKWKSAPVLSSIIKSRKETKRLSPREYCLLHAADLLVRLETVILPALRQRKIVLCDRYLFTSLARDAARGLDPAQVLSLFKPVIWPDLVFYFSVSPETALQRIQATRQPKYYEAGQDVTRIADPSVSFKVFMPRVIKEYENMAHRYNFLKIDAERPIQAQQRAVCAHIQDRYQHMCRVQRPQPTVHPFAPVRAG